ncbi:hypothetical protein GS682_10165 [Nostoc sp. B(2019)]|nr:hypothetical protein [Nostoc sp. B(2019)]
MRVFYSFILTTTQNKHRHHCDVRYDRRSRFTSVLSYWPIITSDRPTAFTTISPVIQHLKL